MLKINSIQTNFSSGELSPWLKGRSDIERYASGAEIIENIQVKPQGGLVRRLGSRFLAATDEQDETKTVRILDFVFSRTECAHIEISEGYFRIYPSVGIFLSYPEVEVIYGTADPVPYLDADINDLQFTQSADVIYITHPDYPQATLSRYSNSDWRYEVPVFEYGPYLDQERGDQNTSLTLSGVTDRVLLSSTVTNDFAPATSEYLFNGNTTSGETKIYTSYEDAALITVGATVSGKYIQPGTTVISLTQDIAQSYITISLANTGTATSTRFTTTWANGGGLIVGDYVEYSYSGQRVLGLVKSSPTDESVEVEPLEDRSLVLSKEVYSPGLYLGWDATNNVPTYTGTITGSGVSVAFSAVGVVTQEHVGNYLRFTDRSGTYYWMLVTGVEDILRQGAYGIIATGDILDVHVATGVVTRSDRVLNARLTASSAGFFDLATDYGRLFRLVLGDTVVHATGRAAFTRSVEVSTGEKNIGMSNTTGLNVGDTISGTHIAAGSVIEYIVDNLYVHVSLAPTGGGTSPVFSTVTATINANTTTAIGVNLNRSIPRSVEGLTTVQNGTTNDWNRGAWYTGNYPTTVSFHEGRLGFAGSPEQPQTVWLSKTDDIHNFAATDEKLRVLDDSAITFTIASDTVNQVVWMQSRQVLLLGSVGSEWRVSSTTPGAPLTPTTVSVSVQSSYGSEAVKPISIGKSCIYLQRGGNKIREMSYDYQTDSQVSIDLTVFSEHILKDHGGATQIAYQPLPDPTIYALLADGQIAVFAYEPDQKVYAWSRFALGGPQAIVESITSLPARSEGTYYDAIDWNSTFKDSNTWLYMIVRRYINGNWVRSIERIEPEFRPASTTDRERMVFMDGYELGYDQGGVGVPTSSITGLTRFAGCTVSVIMDDLVVEDLVVTAGGALTLPSAASSYVWIGHAYTSTLKTFPIEAPAQFGTGQGKQKRIHKITLRLRDSIDFNHGSSLADMREEVFRVAADPTDVSPPMYTGDKTVEYENGYDTNGAFYITQDKSYPLAILALMPEFAQMQ